MRKLSTRFGCVGSENLLQALDLGEELSRLHRLGARGNETGQSESDETPQARRDQYRGDVGQAKHSEKNSEPEHRDAGERQEVPLLVGLATLSISSTGFPGFLEQTLVGLGPGGGERGVVIIDDSAPGVGNDRIDQCLFPWSHDVSLLPL